ncbi:lysylphosphatidylglycerol synthase transmembrane domain-containing protein [Sanguibacter sp. 25GB23B1]|uniref:lysylphosphatidylglycerol synthase transmembrane domain-containing protein n=1 Tax=unclassified Sanguibacter TaxID=2645534 RepID=UPI0032AF5E00
MSTTERPEPVVHDVGTYHVPDAPLGIRPSARPGLLHRPDADERRPVVVVDTPLERVRQPRDLLAIILTALGAVLVLVLAVYGHGTTEGVQADVQSFSSVLASVFFLPVVAVLEGLVTLVVPLAVLAEIAIRKLGRQVVECIAALVLGLALSALVTWSLMTWGSDDLLQGMSVPLRGVSTLTIPGYVAGVTGLLTAAGRARRRTVTFSWNLLWISLAIVLVIGQVSLAGVLLTLLLGRLAGLAVRYVAGVRSERAYGDDLVEGVRRAGFRPVSLVRVRDVADEVLVHGGHLAEADADASALAIARYSDSRVYALTQEEGPRLDVVVLDGDRQVIGFLTRAWRSLRLRGLDGRSAISLRAVAERAALLAYAAQAAGVRSPKLEGIAEVDDSMLLVQEHAVGTVPLRELSTERITDDLLRDAWRQLDIAHSAGLAHRALTSDVVLVGTGPGGEPQVWLTGWESGDVASSVLARRMDLTQMIAILALRVGASRAMASAVAVLDEEDIAGMGPLMQSVALPASTREELRAQRELLPGLRSALVERLPQADVEPVQLVRFGARTILTLAITIIAVSVVVTTINFEQIEAAVVDAEPWWAIVAFALGLLTWFGGAVTFVAFSPVRLPLLRATLVQAAASFVALAAPAGIGPAALNLRMLTRRGVSTSLAVATVALVQASQFVVTILLLVLLSVLTRDGGALRSLPSTTVLAAIISVAAVAAVAFLVPAARRWLRTKLQPMFQQLWPRLSEMLGQPGRIALGVLGNTVMTLGYVFAFDASLAAFGREVSLIDVAVVFLVGNTVGSLAPTPGGLGAIELALVTGLTTTASIPAPIATSAVVLFRVVTYWLRIPLGWVAMRYLQKRGDL